MARRLTVHDSGIYVMVSRNANGKLADDVIAALTQGHQLSATQDDDTQEQTTSRRSRVGVFREQRVWRENQSNARVSSLELALLALLGKRLPNQRLWNLRSGEAATLSWARCRMTSSLCAATTWYEEAGDQSLSQSLIIVD